MIREVNKTATPNPEPLNPHASNPSTSNIAYYTPNQGPILIMKAPKPETLVPRSEGSLTALPLELPSELFAALVERSLQDGHINGV